MKKFALICLFLVTFPSIALSLPANSVIIVTVTKVTDGDTVKISSSNGPFICRLYGIDAPETPKRRQPGQPYGLEAKKTLESLIARQTVKITVTGDKTYGREVCMIEKDGTDINLEMIKLGYAWAYVRYLKRPYASEYIDAEREARKKKLGLWKQGNPEPPWEYRARYRKR